MEEKIKNYKCILTIKVGNDTITRTEKNFETNFTEFQRIGFIKNEIFKELNIPESTNYTILFWFNEEFKTLSKK